MKLKLEKHQKLERVLFIKNFDGAEYIVVCKHILTYEPYMGAQMTITHVCWEQGVLHLIFHREYHFILLNFVLNMVQS